MQLAFVENMVGQKGDVWVTEGQELRNSASESKNVNENSAWCSCEQLLHAWWWHLYQDSVSLAVLLSVVCFCACWAGVRSRLTYTSLYSSFTRIFSAWEAWQVWGQCLYKQPFLKALNADEVQFDTIVVFNFNTCDTLKWFSWIITRKNIQIFISASCVQNFQKLSTT